MIVKFFTLLTLLACSGVTQIPVQANELIAVNSCDQLGRESTLPLCQKSQKITVKLFPENAPTSYNASGTLMGKEQQQIGGKILYLYLLVTNHHVREGLDQETNLKKEKYRLQTFDGRIYKTYLYPTSINWHTHDLDVFWFVSEVDYPIGKAGDTGKLAARDEVYVSGFVCQSNGNQDCPGNFLFTSGEVFIELIKTNKYLVDGYQLGFSNDTKVGTSGGPVLNEKGLVVGINGAGKDQQVVESANPNVPDVDPYKYMEKGTPASEATRQRFAELAWAIPIETYFKYLPKNPFKVIVKGIEKQGLSQFLTYEPVKNNIYTIKNIVWGDEFKIIYSWIANIGFALLVIQLALFSWQKRFQKSTISYDNRKDFLEDNEPEIIVFFILIHHSLHNNIHSLSVYDHEEVEIFWQILPYLCPHPSVLTLEYTPAQWLTCKLDYSQCSGLGKIMPFSTTGGVAIEKNLLADGEYYSVYIDPRVINNTTCLIKFVNNIPTLTPPLSKLKLWNRNHAH